MKSLIALLIVTALLSGFARELVESAETATSLPDKGSEVIDSRAYAHYLMGLIYDRQGEFEEAIKEYRKALQFDPNSSSITAQLIKDYLWLGRVYQKHGKLEEAVKKYESLLELYSDDPDKRIALRFLLAAIYEKNNRLKEASTEMEKVMKLKPNGIEAYLQLGRLYLKRNLVKKGIGVLERGKKLTLQKSELSLLPQTAPEGYLKDVQRGIYFLLGLAYNSKGDYGEAASIYREYVSLDPGNDRARFYLGASLERQGKVKEAILEFKKSIELNPRNAEALNYLGYIYAEKGINLDESIKLTKRALEISPESSYIVDSLGWAYFKKGMFDEALVELKRAVTLSVGRNEDDAVIRDHLGDVYFKKGMVAEAVRQWEKSLELDPKNDKVKEKLKKAKKNLP